MRHDEAPQLRRRDADLAALACAYQGPSIMPADLHKRGEARLGRDKGLEQGYCDALGRF